MDIVVIQSGSVISLELRIPETRHIIHDITIHHHHSEVHKFDYEVLYTRLVELVWERIERGKFERTIYYSSSHLTVTTVTKTITTVTQTDFGYDEMCECIDAQTCIHTYAKSSWIKWWIYQQRAMQTSVSSYDKLFAVTQGSLNEYLFARWKRITHNKNKNTVAKFFYEKGNHRLTATFAAPKISLLVKGSRRRHVLLVLQITKGTWVEKDRGVSKYVLIFFTFVFRGLNYLVQGIYRLARWI